MSIVDNALQSLNQSSRATPLPLGPADGAGRMAQSVAHELYRGGQPGRRTRPWARWAALALLLLGAATWWLLERAKPSPTTTTTAVLALAVPQATPASAASVPAPKPERMPPALAVVAPPTPASASTLPAKPATNVAVLPLLQASAAAPTAHAARVERSIHVARTTVSAHEWQQQGWREMDHQRSEQALDTWQHGLDQMPGNSRHLVYALAFNTLPLALAHARRMQASAPTLVLREAAGQQQLYRVLLLTDTQAAAQTLKNQWQVQAPYLWVRQTPRRAASSPQPGNTGLAATAVTGADPLPVGQRSPALPQVAAAAEPPAQPQRAVTVVPPAQPVPPVPASQPAAARTDMQFSVDDSATRALDALSRGDLAEASHQAESLVNKQPNRWEGHFVLGSALLANGRVREAEAPLERALELQPNSARVLLQRAIAAQESGQPARAVGLLRRAKSIAPDNQAVWLNLGYSAELSNARDEAVAAYQRYLQLSHGRTGTDTQRAYVSERLRILGQP